MNFSLEVKVFGDLEKVSETISKARCRIFYKGLNRNSTFITDEFADLLLSTLPYTPVKGIYDNYEQDYTDHGSARQLGRIYGIVPENPNVAYEPHEDEDGVIRDYACCDVLLFTALYDEAYDILSKSQSMELYEPSIEGSWKIIEGNKCFVFNKACFLGLQVLGEDVEPCFEGASFYTLASSLKEMVDKIEAAIYNLEKKEEESESMNFKLSDDQKNSALWQLLNADEELNYSVCAVYDDYCIAMNLNDGTYERVSYTKDNDSVSLGERTPCFIVDVTESELQALNTIRAINGETFEKIDETFNSLNEKVGSLTTDLETKTSEYAALESKKSEIAAKYDALVIEHDTYKIDAETQIYQLENQVEGLNSYKLGIEKSEKEAVLDRYSQKLTEEVIGRYQENLSEYTIESLEKELAFELVNANPEVFSLQKTPYVPKDEPKTGLEALLDKYN